ncbi:TetR/AcrR family transcriptional regulator [Microbacteriaceae bacterium VKM Ac-2854]|nr:TetR/AcrR family transcriptional regulator [Microbacteriaceae bacterium VKM Ac-2854]
MSDAKQRMIDGAVVLLATRGLQATSFSEVLAATGAPRGSVYHHFPDGKDQLVMAAVDLAGERANAALDAVAGRPADEVTAHFLALWRAVLTRSQLTAGCSVAAVTVATDSAELLEHTSAVFRGWRARLAELLETGGLPAADARRFAALLVAGSEGAVVVARGEGDLEPFDLVAESLLMQAKALQV